MARSRNRPDPEAGPLELFAHDLQVLRRRAGDPDYRSMARRAGCAPSTLSTAAGGKRFPSLETTLVFVRACGGNEREQAAWAQRWKAVNAELARSADATGAAALTPVATGPERAWNRRLWITAVSCLAAGFAAGALTVALAVSPTRAAETSPPSTAAAGSQEPVRRHDALVMTPGTAVNLDSRAQDWDEQPDPGPADTDFAFGSTDRALTGLRNADMAIPPVGSGTVTFSTCADLQDYGVSLPAGKIRPGRTLCDITSDKRVAMLRVTGVRHDSAGAPDRISFDVVVWVRLHTG